MRKVSAKVVSLLQHFWRSTLFREKKLTEQLQATWNVALASAITTASKKKQAPVKGRKSKENPTAKYLNITSIIKNQVLSTHYLAAKQRFAQEFKAYLAGKKAGNSDIQKPVFTGVPGTEEMLKLIEKASEQANPPAESS